MSSGYAAGCLDILPQQEPKTELAQTATLHNILW